MGLSYSRPRRRLCYGGAEIILGAMTTADQTDLMTEAVQLRPMLYRLALAQLGEKAAAEDAVQETLLVAIESGHKFQGRSSVRTWLVAILKHKVLDELRIQKAKPAAPDTSKAKDDPDAGDLDVLFDDQGRWAEPKDPWSDPHTAAEQSAFFKVLEACLTRLPQRTSRAFLMREWLELTPDEICSELSVTPGNLRVLLWRARMQLRLCLDLTWERG